MVEQPIESIFARSWALLNRNWIIIVPGIVIGLIVGVATGLLAPQTTVIDANGQSVTTFGGNFWGSLLLGLIGLIGYIATVAYTTGMAGAAWLQGTTTLADGTRIFERDAGRIVLVGLGLLVLAVIAVVLLIPTLGLAFLAYVLFTLYAFPAAIVGDRPAGAAISESLRLAVARFFPTLIVAVVVFGLRLLGGIVGAALGFAPLIGPIVGAIVTQVVVAYATLLVVGEYLNLERAGTVPPTPTPPPPPAPY
ncbi:MAG TPA: hypothetical protein VMD91_07950 [Candidatus Sulfotelmatobacter sp.]|nr:hypothetical protein [Candidatus Sulfotelmatobacter sp.]